MNENPSKPMRIARFLSMCGVASRRKSEEIIRSGRVQINGSVQDDPACNVDPASDEVTLDGKPVSFPDDNITLIYNKPRRVIVSRDDPDGRQTVYDELPEEFKSYSERLRYGGRLDYMSEGLLIMSTDGNLIHQLTHPGGGSVKKYSVDLHRKISPDDMIKCLKGVRESGELLRCVSIEESTGGTWPENRNLENRVIIELAEGKNRHIRRMLTTLGYETRRLMRLSIGDLDLGELQHGEWRQATKADVDGMLRKS